MLEKDRLPLHVIFLTCVDDSHLSAFFFPIRLILGAALVIDVPWTDGLKQFVYKQPSVTTSILMKFTFRRNLSRTYRSYCPSLVGSSQRKLETITSWREKTTANSIFTPHTIYILPINRCVRHSSLPSIHWLLRGMLGDTVRFLLIRTSV